MTPPLVLDIDGTLTHPDKSLDTRVVEPIRSWPEPVVIATGQVLPYAAALTRYLGIPRRAIGENGGVAVVDGEFVVFGDRDAKERLEREWKRRGGTTDEPLNNHWRETELAVVVDDTTDVESLEVLAAEHGLSVVDAVFSYHVSTPTVNKGVALEAVCDRLGYDAEMFVAVGDAHNDVSTFERVGESYAVANADESVQNTADHVTDGSYADGTLEVLHKLG